MAANNTHAGHRTRLRKKFLVSGIEALHDYEVIELLLTLGTPRSDCKAQAKELIIKFGGLKQVIDADETALQIIYGIGPNNIFGIRLFRELIRKYQELTITKRDIFNSPNQVYLYLKEKIGKSKKEKFVALFFDIKNKLIVDDISTGTLGANLVHPREVFESAVKNHASHIIVSHNHPSGDPSPSSEDFETTKRLIEAGKILGIQIVDHIITGSSSFISFKAEYPELFM